MGRDRDAFSMHPVGLLLLYPSRRELVWRHDIQGRHRRGWERVDMGLDYRTSRNSSCITAILFGQVVSYSFCTMTWDMWSFCILSGSADGAQTCDKHTVSSPKEKMWNFSLGKALVDQWVGCVGNMVAFWLWSWLCLHNRRLRIDDSWHRTMWNTSNMV